MSNTAWSFATLLLSNWPLLHAIAAEARPLIAAVDPAATTCRDALDLSFSLLSFSWSFAYLGQAFGAQGAAFDSVGSPCLAGASVPTACSKQSGGSCPAAAGGLNDLAARADAARGAAVARELLDGIMALARALDIRMAGGGGSEAAALDAGGAAVWAFKVAPAAQGGIASLSRVAAAVPPRAKSPASCRGAAMAQSGAAEGEATPEEPMIVYRPRCMVVVLKPVNWEVDGLTSEGGTGAHLLSAFLRRQLPRAEAPLARIASLDYGFIHRLDVPSSGLVLGGTSLEGLMALKWQIAVYAIGRQYLTANDGSVRLPRLDVAERIDANSPKQLRSLTDDSGKPALTHLSTLAHFSTHGDGCSAGGDSSDGCGATGAGEQGRVASVLAIAIHTGRRHQIRAHTRHVGHPTITDARYAPRDVVVLRAQACQGLNTAAAGAVATSALCGEEWR
eukprot:NODE_3714_length_1997_cov_3.316043.p1 GENE.NODE_3714_length_1997_cov_3.316043~~NODE_3714_length_1997_cov_3.316043.p1  ORF type:complete len:449 (-),score=123.70 NODE_3714_length_1997_cov_3.316043:240-1586(-)